MNAGDQTGAVQLSSRGRVLVPGLIVLFAAFLGWLLFAEAAGSFAPVWGAGIVVLVAASLLAWRPTSGTRGWWRFVSETADLHALGVGLAFVLAAPYLVPPPTAFGSGISSDGCIYFAYLRSLVFDHDLQIQPEMDFLQLIPRRPHAIVPVGPTIVWAPLYLVVTAVDWIRVHAGFTEGVPSGLALGLTGPYVRSVFVSAWLVAAAGLTAIHWRLRSEFGRGPALVTSLLLVGATPLPWYLMHEIAMTHGPSFGVVALALMATDAWFRRRVPDAARAALVGGLIGFAVLIRPQDGLFGLFPIVAAVAGMRSGSVRPWMRALAWLAVGVLPFALGQILWGRVLLSQGSQPFVVAGQGGYLNLTTSRWLDVLFSSRHGLLSLTPIVTVALLGSVAYLRRNIVWALPALLVFAAMCWINGSTADWSGGSSFGGRRFVSTLAALAPGLALVVAWLVRRPLIALAPLVCGVVFWNHLLMTQRQMGILPSDEAVRFDWIMRQQVDLYLQRPYFYPFSFPANAIFAWREDLPIDAYDLLGIEPLRAEMEIPLEETMDRYLLGAWRPGGRDEFGSRYRLIRDAGAVVAPLDVPANAPYAVEIRARVEGGPSGTSTTILNVELNGQYLGALMLDPAVREPSRTTLVTRPDLRDRLWRKGYNRLTIRRTVSVKTATPENPPATVFVYAVRFGPQTPPASHDD